MPPEVFPLVPLTRQLAGSPRVSFAENVEVIGSSPALSSPEEEMFSPEEAPDSPDVSIQHVPDVITIAPPTYELFPFADPFEDLELFVTPRFPYLPPPPGYAAIHRPGEIPTPAGMATQDWSSFIRPASPSQISQTLPGWNRDDQDRTSSTILPIAHIPLTDAGAPPAADSRPSNTSDCDEQQLASLLTRSSFHLISCDSAMSPFKSAMDSLVGPAPAAGSVPVPEWRLKREGPFVAPTPHLRIGDAFGGCAF